MLTIAGIAAGVVLLGPYLGYHVLGNGPEGALRVNPVGNYSNVSDSAPARRDAANRDLDQSLDLPKKPVAAAPVVNREPPPVRKDQGKGSGKLSEIENLLR